MPKPRARHRAPRRARGAIRGLLTAIAMTATAVVLGAAGAGVSVAFLSSSADALTGVTVASGTANLAVATESALTGGALVPTATSDQRGSFTLTNTGDVPLTVTPTVTPSSGNATLLANAKLELALVSTATACTSGMTYTWSKTGTGAATGSLATLAARDRFTGAAGSVSARLCARVTLLSTAPVSAAGGTVNYQILLDGRQAFS